MVFLQYDQSDKWFRQAFEDFVILILMKSVSYKSQSLITVSSGSARKYINSFPFFVFENLTRSNFH